MSECVDAVVVDRVRPDETNALFTLLTDVGLPLDGLRDHLGTTVVARQGGRIVGSAALELSADGALLRSVAVARDLQRHGVGRALVDAAIGLAQEHDVRAVYLLTTTAAHYFPRFGFNRIERSEVPPRVRSSVEFTMNACRTAVVMRKVIPPAFRR